MRRLCYQVATSLDGYIAGPQGEYDWIVQDPEVDFEEMFARFDTLLMGRRTFDLAVAVGRETTPGKKTVVVSRTLSPANHPGVTVLGEAGLAENVSRLKAEPGKDIWLFGGARSLRASSTSGSSTRSSWRWSRCFSEAGSPSSRGAPSERS